MRQNLGHRVPRVQAVIRVLKNHLNLPQIDRGAILYARRQGGPAMQRYVAFLWRNQPGNGLQNGRFAAPTLTDKA